MQTLLIRESEKALRQRYRSPSVPPVPQGQRRGALCDCSRQAPLHLDCLNPRPRSHESAFPSSASVRRVTHCINRPAGIHIS
jgi:hypothetical protein